MKIFITGKPGSGKTTIIEKIVEKLENKITGFYTKELRENGKRVGFEIITLKSKKREILAHVNTNSKFKVGKYKVNITGFEKLIEKEFSNFTIENTGLIIIDEVGKMELFSRKFTQYLKEILLSNKDGIGVVHQNTKTINWLKKIAGDELKIIEVTINNRNELPDKIIEIIREKNE